MEQKRRAVATSSPLSTFQDGVALEVARALSLRPGASMDELAAAAGVSRATLFRRFPSRDALIGELCTSAVQAFLDAVDRAEPESGDSADAWDRVVDGVAELASVFGLLGLQPLSAHLETALLERASVGEDRIRQLLRRGQRSGHFADDVDPEWVLTLLTWSTVAVADAARLGRMTLEAAQRHMRRTLSAALVAPRTAGDSAPA
ncbi:TetR/AcrR family transcriptional regulator [Alloalcanivorax gelatiniphagus]